MAHNLTLSQLCASIGRMFQQYYCGSYRIVAETLDVNHNKATGHYYLELVEKDKNTDQIVARMRATIWRMDADKIIPLFEKVTGQKFATGLEVLVTVGVRYHPSYGLSLVILGIEPEYTLGDIAKKRQELIERLKKEGIYGKNKDVELRQPIKTIAIISSATAAGLGDFRDQLDHNRDALPFHCVLFPAILQGERMERSVTEAFNKIKESPIPFDAVVIIRGGGATADLRYFDSYALARIVALFPLPVLTGIGHQRDECLLDHVAAFPLKTPTAVAEFLLDLRRKEIMNLSERTEQFIDLLRELSQRRKNTLQRLALGLPPYITQKVYKEKDALKHFEHRLLSECGEFISKQRVHLTQHQTSVSQCLTHDIHKQNIYITHCIADLCRCVLQKQRETRERLATQAQLINILSPQRTLSRGFSIVRKNGKAVTKTTELSVNEEVELIMSNGKIKVQISLKDQ